MIKKIILSALIFTCSFANAQKPQRIAYVDMEYILQNVPDYQKAQQKLDSKAASWRKKIEKTEKEIENLKAELNNEKILLTDDLILEKQEEIDIKVFELNKMRATYFGVEGSLFQLRQQLVQPIQDQVFNAIKSIVKRKKYDFVFERSSELLLLHANKKYDISKTVIQYVTKSRKEIEKEEAKIKKKEAREARLKRIEEQRAKRAKRDSKVIHR